MQESELRELQEELARLQQQLGEHRNAILRLSQRIEQLGGKPLPASRVQRELSGFSLENFIGLRLIHIIGIVVLVIGLSIGVKYAIDRELISEGMRIGLAYGAGVVLYLLSVRLRSKYGMFSAILFSGGMASLYFTTYAAHVYYQFFPYAIAFILMILFTIYSVLEAIRYNRQEIAMLGLVGAYAIPFLISRNSERADLYFLYISIINLGVVYVRIRQGWPNVARAAQYLTWVLFLRWASMSVAPADVGMGALFLCFFFALFQFAIIFPQRNTQKPMHVNDTYSLVLNNMAFYMGALMLYGYAESASLALITLLMALFTGAQAAGFYFLRPLENAAVRMLSALALVLFILFIAFQWSGFTVTLLWLLTAIVLFAWGFFMHTVSARMTAMVLTGVTLGKLIAVDSMRFSPVQKVIAYVSIGVLLLVASFLYQKYKEKIFQD